MELKALRMYYKAAVVVPFYTMCFFVIVTFLTGTMFEMTLKVTLYSGITGLLATTIFLNRFWNIASHFTYSLTSFFLLPAIFISYVLWTDVDWEGIKVSGGNVVYSTLLFIIFMIHLIGLAISFIDFRRSIVMTLEEKRNELRTIYDDQLPYV